MKRTTEQMDEKDWIIVRLMSLLDFAVPFTPTLEFENDYCRTCGWLDANLTLMSDSAWNEFNPVAAIRAEQGFTIADWPYAVIEEPPPPDCQLVGGEV